MVCLKTVVVPVVLAGEVVDVKYVDKKRYASVRPEHEVEEERYRRLVRRLERIELRAQKHAERVSPVKCRGKVFSGSPICRKTWREVRSAHFAEHGPYASHSWGFKCSDEELDLCYQEWKHGSQRQANLVSRRHEGHEMVKHHAPVLTFRRNRQPQVSLEDHVRCRFAGLRIDDAMLSKHDSKFVDREVARLKRSYKARQDRPTVEMVLSSIRNERVVAAKSARAARKALAHLRAVRRQRQLEDLAFFLGTTVEHVHSYTQCTNVYDYKLEHDIKLTYSQCQLARYLKMDYNVFQNDEKLNAIRSVKQYKEEKSARMQQALKVKREQVVLNEWQKRAFGLMRGRYNPGAVRALALSCDEELKFLQLKVYLKRCVIVQGGIGLDSGNSTLTPEHVVFGKLGDRRDALVGGLEDVKSLKKGVLDKYAPYVDTAYLGPGCSGLFMLESRTKGGNVAWHDGRCMVSGKTGDSVTNAIIGTRPNEAWSYVGLRNFLPITMALLVVLHGAKAVVPEYSREVREWADWVKTLYNETTNTISINSNIGQVRAHATQIANLREDLRRIIRGRGSPSTNSSLSTIDAAGLMLKFLDRELQQSREIANAHKHFVERLLSLMEEVRKVMASLGTLQSETYYLLKMYDDLVTEIYNLNTFSMSLMDENRTSIDGLIEIMKDDLVFIRNNVNEQTANVQRVKRTLRFDVENSITKENVGIVTAVIALNLVSNFKLVVPSVLFFIILFVGNFQASAARVLRPVSVSDITLVDSMHCINDYCSTDKLATIKAAHEINKCFFMNAGEYDVKDGVVQCKINVRPKREISKKIDELEKSFSEYRNNYTEKAKAYWQDVKDSKLFKVFETMTDSNKLILCVIALITCYFFLGSLATATAGVVAFSVLSFDAYISSETLVILFWVIVIAGSFIFFGPHAAFIVIVFWAISRHSTQAAHCSDRLMHTMVGMRYRSNNEVLNVTGGFIPLTVGHCYYWKVSVNGENVTKSFMLKNVTVSQESWQTIFSTPEHFEQVGCMDWVCSETLNRHCERDLKAAVARMDITHVWQDIATEMYGFWRCGCAGTCYKESWVGIGINNSTMCEYQSRNTVDSYKLVLVLDDSKQVSTVNFRQKINTWFDVLGGKFKIITPIGEMAPRFRLVCGHKTYYMNDKLSIPHDVLKIDRVGVIDWSFFEKLVRYEYYAATDTSKFDLKLISIFESLPSNFWTDKDYHFQFEIVELEAKIEDVVFELDDCNVTHVTRSGEVSRAMSQLVSVKVKVFSTNSPCKLQVSNDDELCMPISSSFYSVFKKIDIIDIVDFAASDCITYFVVSDKNLTNVRVPAMSAWSYVGYYQHKLMGIVGYDDGGWFNFKFDLGQFIDNRVVQSCIALVILYFVFLSNPIMAVVVMIFGVMIWQVKGEGMDESFSNEDLFVRIACSMLFFFLYNQISKLRMRRLSYDPIVFSVLKMHTIAAEVGQMINSVWVLFSVVVLRFSIFWGIYCFVYGLVKKYKFATCSFRGFVLIDEGDLNLFIWHFLNFPNVFLFNCLLNGFDGTFTILMLFCCTFCKLYRIHLFAWDYVLSLHCLVKYDFSKVDDILVTDLNLLRNFEGNQVEQLDKCCQVTDYDLACPYHNGLSATFENGKYINDSRIIENHWYCGWSKLVGNRVKNVVVDTEVSCKYLNELENSTKDAEDAEVRQVFEMLQNVISTKEHGLMCGIKVEYGVIEKAAVTVGHEDFFVKAKINQVHIPVIYRLVCGNRQGFAFMYKGAVYSSYHVTRGKAIVIPEVKRDGMSEKQLYLPVSVDKQLDYCVYGLSNQLDDIKQGKWYVVINPEQQQSILLKAEQDQHSVGGEGVILMKRYVVTKDNELLVYNVFGKFGWSGLPIISLDSSEVVGIYGKMIANADNTGASVQLPKSMGNIVPTDWDKVAEEILACGNKHSVKTVNTPTASGKSTLFPLALARGLYSKRHGGLIVVLNPLRAVPVALTQFVRGLLKSAKMLDKVVVHYSIGKEESYTMDSELHVPGKVVIVYMTYGKYMTRRSHLTADVVLADEVHCQQPEVVGTIDTVSKRIKDGKENFKFVLMTATPKNQAIADRQISEEAQNINKDQVKKHHVKIDDNFYFDTQYLCNKTKHLIFVPSRKACIDVQVALRTRKFQNIYNFYSKHESGFDNIDKFNNADTAVLISTNAIESGITLIGLTHVWDSRLEYKPRVSGNRVILDKRIIDKISVTQRRGRVGRTGGMGFYIYPEVRNQIRDEHNDTTLIERQVAVYLKWLTINRNDMEDVMWNRIAMIDNLWRDVPRGDDFWELMVNSKIDAITLRSLCEFDESKDSGRWLINPEVSRVAWQDYIKECNDGEMTIARYFNLQSDLPYDKMTHFALAEREEDNNLQVVASSCAVLGCTLVLAEMVATLRGFCYVEEMYLVFDKDWRSFGAYGYYDFIFGYDKDVVIGSLLSNTDQKDTQAFWARTNMPERYKSSLQKRKPWHYIVKTQHGIAGFFLIVDPSGVLKVIADTTLEGSSRQTVNFVVNTTYLGGLREYFIGMQSQFKVIEENSVAMVTPEQAITAVKNFAGPVYIAAMSFAPGGVWLAGGVGVAWDLLVSKLGTYNAIVVATICSSLFISPVISITSVAAANFTYLIKRILFGACLDEASRAIPATPVALTSSLLFFNRLELHVQRCSSAESSILEPDRCNVANQQRKYGFGLQTFAQYG
ncbi:MAG: polyprotein [Fushun flavivirus 1]|nr:MAG: polyprotein [Fushun flavivirus 1]